MLLDAFVSPRRSNRRSNRRSSTTARIQPVAVDDSRTDSSRWRIERDYIAEPLGRRVPLVRHGLDRYAALELLATATVLHGDFPAVTEIAGDSELAQSLIGQLSTSGDLFTVFASLYRRAGRDILLLDYLH